MMSSNDRNKVCITCGNTSGKQFTCNGCQQSFCWEHIEDHQQYIDKQMDTLVQNHHLIVQDWNNPCYYNQLFQKIQRWEKESIEKIQITAQTARLALRSFIKQSKDNLEISFKQISQQIDQSRQLNNYSEIDINKWTQQLKYIQSRIQTSFYIEIKEDEQTAPIYLIKIKQNIKRLLDENEQTVKRLKIEMNDNISNNYERFDKVFGKALFDEQNLLAINNIRSRSFISGANLYSTGKHILHLKIQQLQKKGSSCFFGVMTSNEQMKEPIYHMKSVYGVWLNGCKITCGQTSGTSANKRWDEVDNVTLTLDCDNKTIYIENKQINWCEVLNIDLDFCPLPWKFLIIIKKCIVCIENQL